MLLCSVDESILHIGGRVEHLDVFENGVTSLVEESSFAFDFIDNKNSLLKIVE